MDLYNFAAFSNLPKMQSYSFYHCDICRPFLLPSHRLFQDIEILDMIRSAVVNYGYRDDRNSNLTILPAHSKSCTICRQYATCTYDYYMNMRTNVNKIAADGGYTVLFQEIMLKYWTAFIKSVFSRLTNKFRIISLPFCSFSPPIAVW